jgi:hypothetical protein
MARTFAILKALARAVGRDQRSLESVVGNNFFIVTLLLLEEAGTFIYLLIGLVLLFPLSTDPLRKIPASRLALWPLEHRERRLLRLVSPWVSPAAWLIVALALWAAHGRLTVGLWGLVAGLVAAGFLLSDLPFAPSRSIWLAVPNFPGPWNQLVRKNVRAILSTLDFYCALLLTLAAVAFRIAGLLPREGLFVLTLLVQVALSSYAQSLFGLDGRSGRERYRLLPLRGWQVLFAKDAAFLAAAILLALPLAPISGAGAALIALAVGHQPSVNRPRIQARWRFSSGGSIILGLVQAALMAAAASAIYFTSPLFLAACIAAWALSLWHFGRMIESTGLSVAE